MRIAVEWVLVLAVAVLGIGALSRLSETESKVVGKTPAGFHRKHFQEWLNNCYGKEPAQPWCIDAWSQPSLILEFPE